MPKMKTKAGAKKRFKISSTGKIVRKKAYKSHLLTKKAHVRKKNLGQKTVVSDADRSNIKLCLAK
jgi:large subunit ribosomal protein L35